MEEEVINDLVFISETLDFCKDSQEWNEVLIKLKNPNYTDSLFNIVLLPQHEYEIRIIGISVLLRFQVSPSQEIIPRFFPLLYDENYQSLIAQYIICSCDPQFLIQEIFPALCKDIQLQNENGPLIGLILCFFEFVRFRKMREENILQIIYQIIIDKPEILIDFRKKAIQTIILQINLIGFEESELLHQEVKNIIELFVNLPMNDENFQLFEYLLFFIKKNMTSLQDDTESDDISLLSPYNDEILHKVDEILDFIVKKSPLNPDDIYCSTILYYLVDIIKIRKLIIPFEKAFALLLIGEKQLSNLQEDVDYFQSVTILNSDDFNGIDKLDNNEEEDDYDEINDEDIIKEEIDSFVNDAKTLNDAQIHLLYYLCLLDTEYISDSIENCFSVINQSVYVNLTIIRYFSMMKCAIPIVFNPEEFNCFDNPILQYYLIEFCQIRALSIGNDENNESPDRIYASFLSEFKYNEYFKAMIESEDPVLIICTYSLISSAPRELIDNSIYEAALKAVLLIIPNLNISEARVAFVENIFSSYLSHGDTLEADVDDAKSIKYHDDPDVRRFLSDSIFMHSDIVISAFKEDSQEFFEILDYLFRNLTFDQEAVLSLTKILFYFTGGNIRQYISRNRTQQEGFVNITNYDLFFEEVSTLSLYLVMDYISDDSLAYCGFFIFANSFINIYYPDDQNYIEFIDNVYQMFTDDASLCVRNSLPPDIYDMILRIFIKNEKFLGIDTLCEEYCYKIPSITNEKWKILKNIQILVYELSFVLINKLQIYSPETVKSILYFLIDIFINQLNARKRLLFFDYYTFSSIGIIFARLSLSCNKEEFEEIMNGRPIQRGKRSVDIILNYYFEEIKDRFTDNNELVQKMIIVMYHVHSDNEHAQYLLALLVDHICKKLDPDNFDILSSMDTTISLTKEDIFYDDEEFLTHPLISASICELIRLIGQHPINQEVNDLFEHFVETYPNL